jgi:hypothetical protein
MERGQINNDDIFYYSTCYLFDAFSFPESKFLGPYWGEIVDSGIGLSYRTARLNIGWRTGTTTLCQSRLYPPVRDYEFGYSLPVYTVSL